MKYILLFCILFIAACVPPPTTPTPMVSTYYKDADADNYGDPNEFATATSQPAGYVSDNTDCNDSVVGGDAINPGTTETANLIDDDCDSVIDNGFKYLFVSSSIHNGNLGGLSGADNICQNLANASVNIPVGTYKAWLSSTTINARDRLYLPIATYVDSLGTFLTDGTGSLINSDIISKPKYDENQVEVFDTVFTNTSSSGGKINTSITSTCYDWMQSGPYVTRGGYTDTTGVFWSYSPGNLECDLYEHRIYCLQQ